VIWRCAIAGVREAALPRRRLPPPAAVDRLVSLLGVGSASDFAVADLGPRLWMLSIVHHISC
jgi:hypothetical protein